jgi:hypothetical protein
MPPHEAAAAPSHGNDGHAFIPADSAELWAGFDGVEPPDVDPHSSLTVEERRTVDPEDFWQARPILTAIHQYARARRVGPWAVLGAALARAVAQIPPNIVLPPIVGSVASLNLFVALVGPSGDGKDAARSVAGEVVRTRNADFETLPLGSGEGMVDMFMRPPPPRSAPDTPPIQYRTKVLVTVGEIDSMAALMARNGATLRSQLRQAAMGEQLGFHYRDRDKRLFAPAHRYRLCLIGGVQPRRSAALLSEDQEGGGTPQRFLWLPAGDPQAPDKRPDRPAPIPWTPPSQDEFPILELDDGSRYYEVVLPQAAWDMVDSARLARLRGHGGALDGHALLTREKVAAGLMLLDQRTMMTDGDWELSGPVMAVSDGQRALCLRALQQEREKANTAQGLAEAHRSMVVEETVDRAKVERCSAAVVRLLRQHGPLAGSDLRRRLRITHREWLEPSLNALDMTGQIVTEKVDYRGNRGLRYAIAQKDE